MSDTNFASDLGSKTGFCPDEIVASSIRRVYEYWIEKHRGERAPCPEDIDILDLEFAIGSISFIDVVDPAPRFRMRMIGSEVVARYGKDFTGRIVDEIEDEDTRDLLCASYATAYAGPDPFWVQREMYSGEHVFIYECLILQLKDESGHTIRLMSVLNWPDGSTNLPRS